MAKGIHGQRRIFNGHFSFDYVSLSLEQGKENQPSMKFSKTIGSVQTSQSEDFEKKNAWRKDFTERLELSILNNQIQERLKNMAKAQQDWLAPCFRKVNAETKSAIRRRCFCESIGTNFCAICRRKVNKELSNRIPRIICDLKKSKNELELPERAEYFVTPEPMFCRQLKQASRFYKIDGSEGSHGDPSPTRRITPNTDDDQCLSIDNPQDHAVSSSSSSSSISSLQDPEFLNDVNVPSSPRNSLNTSPVILELPAINTPRSSSDTPNDKCALTTIPQLPAIPNNDIHRDSQMFPITEQLRDTNLKTDSCSLDIPNNQHILAEIPQPPPTITNDSDIPSDSEIFHITHQLRSINELKADACSPNNLSNQNLPPFIQQLPAINNEIETNSSSNLSDPKNGHSNQNSESDLSKPTLSMLGESTKSVKTDVKRTPSDNSQTLPRLPHPVEPVLLELKYINFSIYDYECN